jgi:sulfite reductase (NADPH) hemoprotein beta-component
MVNSICPARFFQPLQFFKLQFSNNAFPQLKVAVAVPPTNDVDVFANNLGLIAIVGEDGELQGFNVTIGGGRGVTHGNKKTYPRLGSIIGFCTPEQGKCMAEKVMLVQRDNGNRAEWVSFILFTPP